MRAPWLARVLRRRFFQGQCSFVAKQVSLFLFEPSRWKGGRAKGGYNERAELNRRTEEKGWGEDSGRDDKNSTTEIKTSERKKKKAEALKEMERKGT